MCRGGGAGGRGPAVWKPPRPGALPCYSSIGYDTSMLGNRDSQIFLPHLGTHCAPLASVCTFWVPFPMIIHLFLKQLPVALFFAFQLSTCRPACDEEVICTFPSLQSGVGVSLQWAFRVNNRTIRLVRFGASFNLSCCSSGYTKYNYSQTWKFISSVCQLFFSLAFASCRSSSCYFSHLAFLRDSCLFPSFYPGPG